jgi:23S rRNA G2445 N2-methylase RlmL
MATNAERQAAFKAKMRQAGKKQIAIWVDPAQQAAIVAFLAGTGELPVTASSLSVTHPPQIKKKRDTREAWQIKNDELWETHRTEFTRRYAAGQKPSQIAAWLNTLGFTGSGATLNGYIKGGF